MEPSHWHTAELGSEIGPIQLLAYQLPQLALLSVFNILPLRAESLPAFWLVALQSLIWEPGVRRHASFCLTRKRGLSGRGQRCLWGVTVLELELGGTFD